MPASERPQPAGPLAGVRVIDLTTVVMGPYATQILADYGADVIKVEPPGGDVMRATGPTQSPGMGPLFLQLNRNKRSVVLDLRKSGARDALLRLCRDADALVHNVRLAGMRRLRLADSDVQAANPRLVYLSLIGYGESGPYAGRPAYDDLIQGFTGTAALIAQQSGIEPRFVPLTMVDRIVGLNAVHTLIAALFQRERTGKATSIELPMFETMAQFVLSDHMGGRSFDPPLGEPGYSRLLAPDRRPYRTRDGYICVLLYTDKQWQSFFTSIDRRAEFDRDPRLSNHATRTKHYDEVYRLLSEILAGRPTAEWLALLQANDIACVPLHDLNSLIDDPHLEAVGFFETVTHPSEGPLRLVGIPGLWDGGKLRIARHPPRLGEHTTEILRAAGLSGAEVAALHADGAAFSAPDPAAG